MRCSSSYNAAKSASAAPGSPCSADATRVERAASTTVLRLRASTGYYEEALAGYRDVVFRGRFAISQIEGFTDGLSATEILVKSRVAPGTSIGFPATLAVLSSAESPRRLCAAFLKCVCDVCVFGGCMNMARL